MQTQRRICAFLIALLMASPLYSLTLSRSEAPKTSNVSVSASETSLKTTETSTAYIYYTVEDNTAVVYSVAPKNFISDEVNPDEPVIISIPQELSGCEVSIASSAFSCISAGISVECNGVKEIKSGAFQNCEGIKSLTVSCDFIQKDAFSNCSNLESVTIYTDSGTCEVDSYAFRNCPGLESLTLNGRIIIRSDAFEGCTSLTNLEVEGCSSDLCLNEGAFNNSELVNHPDIILAGTSESQDIASLFTSVSGRQVLGNFLSICIYVNTDEDTEFELGDIYDIEQRLKSDAEMIVQNAKNYDKSVEISFNDFLTYVDLSENMSGTEIILDTLSKEDAYKEYFAEDNSPTLSGLGNYIRNNLGYDNYSYSLIYNSDDRSYTKHIGGSNYVNYYTLGSSVHTWAHELLHVASAKDYYEETIESWENCCDQDYVDENLSTDIMFSSSNDRIGTLTAYYIGWTDTMLRKDYSAVAPAEGFE